MFPLGDQNEPVADEMFPVGQSSLFIPVGLEKQLDALSGESDPGGWQPETAAGRAVGPAVRADLQGGLLQLIPGDRNGVSAFRYQISQDSEPFGVPGGKILRDARYLLVTAQSIWIIQPFCQENECVDLKMPTCRIWRSAL
jgi:hypothetical protein